MPKLTQVSFTHDFVDSLPADPSRENQPRQVKEAAYSFVNPTPVREPRLVGWSRDLAARFGFETPPESGEEAALLTGKLVLPGMQPYAARYGGHQFGNWAGQLGDGRAITLGEALDEEGQRWEFQLKGAGRTPYSRRGDGRAVLRSSIREFVCSEAMHYLGVPTTRALSVATTGEEVVRDMFYDGNPMPEPGAVVCRLAPTFLRFGNFEIFASKGEFASLERLVNYTIDRFYPEIEGEGLARVSEWFLEVSVRTARLMAEWMRVGFVHGVMNTDNMSILGLTIDYGPYGWLENYDPSWTPNTTDLPGRRYCFGRQPTIGHWNLAQLGKALYALVPNQGEALQAGIQAYAEAYEEAFTEMMSKKLGIGKMEGEEDQTLLVDLEALLMQAETDMTLFYRGLAELPITGAAPRELPSWLSNAFYGSPTEEQRQGWLGWLERYQKRAARGAPDPAARKAAMHAVNPLYVPRNYLLQEAIEKAERGDSSRVEELLQVLSRPYTEQPGKQAFAAKRPDWARDKPGCSTLSCSS